MRPRADTSEVRARITEGRYSMCGRNWGTELWEAWSGHRGGETIIARMGGLVASERSGDLARGARERRKEKTV